MSPQLSTGIIRGIFLGDFINNPVVQVLESLKMNTINLVKPHQRITFSDGKYKTSHALLKSGLFIEKFSVVRFVTYDVIKAPALSLGKIIIVLEIEVLSGFTKIIGEPVNLNDCELNKKSIESESDLQKPANLIKLKPSATVDIGSIKTNSSDINNFSKNNVETIKNPVKPKKFDSDYLDTIKVNAISSLTPHLSKWIIKAKVQSKDQLKKWTNTKGQGAIFSFVVEDESGEIKCTAFYQEAEYCYEHIEIGKIYYISKCKIKNAYKSYQCTNHQYELTIESLSTVEECPTPVSYNFTPIAQIVTVNEETTVDVLGICLKCSEVKSFFSKQTNRELYKRLVTLIDDTMSTIDLTLWEDEATKFDGSNNPVVAIKGAKVGEFASNRILSGIMGSKIEINPNMTESMQLKKWFNTEYQEIDFKPKAVNVTDSRWVLLSDIQDRIITKRNRGGLFYCIAHVLIILRKNTVYKGCPVDYCMKRVEQLEDKRYKCERCQRKFKNFKYRLLLTVNIGDFTGNEWVTVFSKEAETLLGKTAQEVAEALEKGTAGKIFTSVCFKQFVFTCKVKIGDYKGDDKILIDYVENINNEKHGNVIHEMMRQKYFFSIVNNKSNVTF